MKNNNLQLIIPTVEYRKLRKLVLDYLRKNREINGHGSIQGTSRSDRERSELEALVLQNQKSLNLHPFAGMSRLERTAAIAFFWEGMVKAGLVIKSKPDPLHCDVERYHLPGGKG